MEKKFEYLKEISTEELKKELTKTKEDLEYLKEELKKQSGEQKSETINSDIPYDNAKIKYIEEELERRI